MMQRGIFVVGTDTGVGKTVVSAALVRRLLHLRCSVGVMKPVETGVSSDAPEESDAGRLMAAAAVDDALSVVCPYRFQAPLAPYAAAGAAGLGIELQDILQSFERLAARYACVVVEGAGGLLVPMGRDWSIRDLIRHLGIPVVLVGRAGLGGVNHGLLTLESLRREQIKVVALLLNETESSSMPIQQLQVASTLSLLQERAGVPVLGPLRYQAQLGRNWTAAIEILSQSRPIRDLADQVWQVTAGNRG